MAGGPRAVENSRRLMERLGRGSRDARSTPPRLCAKLRYGPGRLYRDFRDGPDRQAMPSSWHHGLPEREPVRPTSLCDFFAGVHPMRMSPRARSRAHRSRAPRRGRDARSAMRRSPRRSADFGAAKEPGAPATPRGLAEFLSCYRQRRLHRDHLVGEPHWKNCSTPWPRGAGADPLSQLKTRAPQDVIDDRAAYEHTTSRTCSRS